MRRVDAARAGAVAVALIPLGVYLLTLQNGLTLGELQGGDPITHQYAQATLRFANAPGYPIFTMLGWLWFQISALFSPLFSPIQRLALYSTLYAIPALLLLYYIILVLVGDPRRPPVVIAALATLFFAFTYFWWYYAISPENYSSGTLNALVIVALALRWQQTRDERTLLWLCFACGLSLAHLLTVALAVPAVVAFVVGQQPDYLRRPKLWLKIIVATFLPLLSYMYIYWRGAEHPEWRGQGNWPSAWAWFLDFILTQQGQAELTWQWDGLPWQMLGMIANELSIVVLLGGLIGLCLLPRWRALLLLGIVAVYAPELYLDRYGNWFQTIIALYPLLVIGAVVLTYRIYVSFAQSGQRKVVFGLLTCAWMLLALNRLVVNFPAANLRDRPAATALDAGWALLADDPAPQARIAGTHEEDLALDYLSEVWGARPDVQTLQPRQVSEVREPVYASRAAMPLVQKALPADAHLATQGLRLIALRKQPDVTMPAAAQPLRLTLTHGLELLGYQAKRSGGMLDLALYWRAAQAIDIDISVSVRAMQGEQPVRFEAQPVQVDSAHPVAGFYPTTRWSAGEVVRDDYALSLAALGVADHLRVIVYRTTASGFEDLAGFDLALR